MNERRMWNLLWLAGLALCAAGVAAGVSGSASTAALMPVLFWPGLILTVAAGIMASRARAKEKVKNRQ